MRASFVGKRVMVTGASQGLGRAIGKEFAQAGAEVWACDLKQVAFIATRSRWGRNIHTRKVDLRRGERVRSLVAEAEAHGPIDILVNNAGGVCGQVGRPIEEVSDEDWEEIFAANATTAFQVTRAVVPGMKRAGSGRIINISSYAGVDFSATGIQAYAAAKAAQIAFTRQLAHELGCWKITVNSVAPGFIRSNPAAEKQWEELGEVGQSRLIESIALKRLGTPEDVAHAVLFFASDTSAWITGQTLCVNGGR